MMSDLRDLYQEVILDHSKNPRYKFALAQANRDAEGYNPLCGDQVEIQLQVEDGRIVDVSFQGTGCAISTASADLMAESVKGKSIGEVQAMFKRYHAMLTGDPAVREEVAEEMGKLAVMSGVREFPVRVKCATLAWHTLLAALEDQDEPVTTE